MKYVRIWESKNFPLIWCEFNIEAVLKKMKEILGVGYTNAFYYVQKGKVETYLSEEDILNQSNVGKKFYEDYKKATEFYKKQENFLFIFKKILKKIEIKLENKNIKIIQELRIFENLVNNIISAFGYYNTSMSPYFLSLQKKFETAVKENVLSKNDVIILTTLTRETTFDKEKRDWLRIILETKKKGAKVVKSLIKVHAETYGYLVAEDVDQVWDESYYKKLLLKELNKTLQEIKKDVTDFRRLKKSVGVNLENLLKKKKIAQDLLMAGKVIREFAWVRLEMRNAWTKGYFIFYKFLDLVAQKRDLSGEDLKYYKIEDISKLLRYNKKVTTEKLNQRKLIYVYAIEQEKSSLYIGKDAEKYFNKRVETSSQKNITYLKGYVANLGKVTGTAIILDFKDSKLIQKIKQMKKGQILIAGQTRPQLMYAIKKAAAIVTDEGGITSHAAIVSRELGVPCIIGTHDATRVFHDGDILEVDATKGIIKLLKKNER